MKAVRRKDLIGFDQILYYDGSIGIYQRRYACTG